MRMTMTIILILYRFNSVMIYKFIDIVTKQPDLQPTQYLLITSVLCSGQSPLKREAYIKAEGGMRNGSGKTVQRCLGCSTL